MEDHSFVGSGARRHRSRFQSIVVIVLGVAWLAIVAKGLDAVTGPRSRNDGVVAGLFVPIVCRQMEFLE